jgi:hypothetical protein
MKDKNGNFKMPKLEAGMLVQIEACPDDWYMVLDYAARLYALLGYCDGRVQLAWMTEASTDSDFNVDRITRVAYSTIGNTAALAVGAIARLLTGTPTYNTCLWERPLPKKKMTVAEIEKELGYSIEIVKG